MRYNEQPPHDSLGELLPAIYRQQLLAKEENSTLEMSNWQESLRSRAAHRWKQAMYQFAIIYGDRLNKNIA
jgi:transposase-like protein